MNQYDDLLKILFTKEQLQARIAELGAQITKDYQNKPLTLICILKGASVFFADLARCIDLPLQMDFMATSSYNNTHSTGEVKLSKDCSQPVMGRDIIIVEDIIDSGLTLSYLKKLLSARGVNSVALCSLLDKPERREVDLKPDYSGFVIPNEFVVGFGLDYNEKYRNLPEIGVLKPELYQI